VGGGLLAVAVIALSILFVGTKLLSDDFISDIDLQQSQQIIQLAQSLHHSDLLPYDRDELQDQLPELASSYRFDALIKEAIFGLDIVRFDLYTVTGERIYTSIPGSIPENAPVSEAFKEARRGIPTSAIRDGVPITGSDGEPKNAQVLTTFGLMEDRAPDDTRGGRPLAILAIYGEVGQSLQGLRTTMWYIVGVFFSGLAVIFLIVYKVSEASRARLQNAHDLLQEQYAAVRTSRERMLAADEAAKRAIAEELHGAVQTKLYAVWMKLGSAAQLMRDDTKNQADVIDAIATEVDLIREDDIRQLSHRLHPGIIRVGALAGLRSLRDYYEQLIPLELQVSASAEDLERAGSSRIPERLRLAAYRVAELGLGNIIKHADASKAVVSWNYDVQQKELVLSVVDDGKGFDDSEIGKTTEVTGIGLTTIDDYADALGGSFELVSKVGEGTNFTVRFPFVDPSNDDSDGGLDRRESRRHFGEEATGQQVTGQQAAGTGLMAGENSGD
jgi:signal transduction histidine kinase